MSLFFRSRAHNPLWTLVVGAAVFCIGIALAVQTLVFVASAKDATAVVRSISYRFDRCKRGKHTTEDCTRFTAAVGFQDSDKKFHQGSLDAGKVSGHCAGCKGNYSIGQQLSILYDPAHPEEMKLKSFTSLWLSSVLCSGLGGLFAVIGGIGYLRR